MAEKTDFDSINLVAFIYKWYKLLVAVAIASIILASIFSSPFFITPLYKSSVIMFPTASNSISKALLNDNANSKNDILGFGEEEQAEQMLQILNSNKIREFIINKYSLMEHYEIDTSSKYKNTQLYKQFEGSISYLRTEFMAVEIEVFDKDPQYAADIANDIASLFDTIKNNMKKDRAIKGYSIVKEEFLLLKNEIKQMEDSLGVIMSLGVLDYESQSEVINQQLAIAISKNNHKAVRSLEKKLDILAKYGFAYISLRDQLQHTKKQLTQLKAKYQEAKVDAEQSLPQKFVVNSAYKAEKKSYPIRWLIVAVTMLSSLFLAILIIIVLENLEKKKPRSN